MIIDTLGQFCGVVRIWADFLSNVGAKTLRDLKLVDFDAKLFWEGFRCKVNFDEARPEYNEFKQINVTEWNVAKC